MPTHPLSSLLYRFGRAAYCVNVVRSRALSCSSLSPSIAMIQPQDWPAVRHERTLPPLSKLITTHDKLRLAELADVASSLGQLNVSSRSASPSSPLDLTLGTFQRGCNISFLAR